MEDNRLGAIQTSSKPDLITCWQNHFGQYKYPAVGRIAEKADDKMECSIPDIHEAVTLEPALWKRGNREGES